MKDQPTQLLESAFRERLLAVLFYSGLVPWLWKRYARERDTFLNHHFRHALVHSYWLATLIGLYALLQILMLVWSLDNPNYASVGDYQPFWWAREMALPALAVGWVVLLAGFVGSAILGLRVEFRPYMWISSKRFFTFDALYLTGPCYHLYLVAIVLALYAFSLAENGVQPASVYLLYDEADGAPAWVYELGFCRVAGAARGHWPDERVVVAPLSEDSLATAFREGRFVFVSAHGDDGYITAHELRYGPEDARAAGAGPRLRLVYIACCHGGLRKDEWARALAPAEVISFARESYVKEHLLWLLSQGPKRIREMASD